MRSDSFETHIRTHGVDGPGGGTMPSPGSYARIRMCPICRFNYDRDHVEALKVHWARPDTDPEASSLAFIINQRIGPDDTQPPAETGFALAGEGS